MISACCSCSFKARLNASAERFPLRLVLQSNEVRLKPQRAWTGEYKPIAFVYYGCFCVCNRQATHSNSKIFNVSYPSTDRIHVLLSDVASRRSELPSQYKCISEVYNAVWTCSNTIAPARTSVTHHVCYKVCYKVWYIHIKNLKTVSEREREN